MTTKDVIKLAVQRYGAGDFQGSAFMLDRYAGLRELGHLSPTLVVAGALCDGDKLANALREMLTQKGVAA